MMGRRVLIVDDEPINREIIMEILVGLGLAVEQAVDGADALEKAQGTIYDLILMDMQMPRMDGPSATRRIRWLPGYAAIPILAYSANSFEDARRQCMDAGMNDFIVKPVRPEALAAIVTEWLGWSGWLRTVV